MAFWDGTRFLPETPSKPRSQLLPRALAVVSVSVVLGAVLLGGARLPSGDGGSPSGHPLSAGAGAPHASPQSPHTPTSRPSGADSRPKVAATERPVSTASTATPRPKAPARTPAPTPQPTPPPRLLFGLGPEADGALRERIVRAAPVHMLTSWYNGHGDLGWMTGWRTTFVPQAYRAGYTLHLIVYSGESHARVATKYGEACGNPYPLSDGFVSDMSQLARTFRGGGRVYVTLFTEFQTYACTNNEWNPNKATNAYWRALKDQYRAALATFHRLAPNSRVSLGWGGWQTRWDKPATGGGRSMFKYFADVMRASDFQSFQAMQTDSNVRDVLAMTRTLGAYGPVMLAHYKPDNGSQAVFNADTRAMLTDAYLRKAVSAGLFAWSFMDERNLSASTSTYSRIAAAIRRYGH
jgi:hypothetical protein